MGDQYIKTIPMSRASYFQKKKRMDHYSVLPPSHILYPIVDGFVHLHRLHFQLNTTSKNQTKGNHGTCVTNVAFGV